MKRVTKIVETTQIFCFIVPTMAAVWFGDSICRSPLSSFIFLLLHLLEVASFIILSSFFIFIYFYFLFFFFFRSNRHGFVLWFSNCRPLIADSDLSVFFFVKTCQRLPFDRSRHLEKFFQNTRAFCTNCTILNFVYKNLYEGLFINLLNYKCPNNKIYIIRMI